MRRTRNRDHGRGPGVMVGRKGPAKVSMSKDGSYLKTWGSRPASKLKRLEVAS